MSNTADREIVITRDFDAPRALVFEAWTQPQHIVQWWGPTGFTNTDLGMDVRPGGSWRFVMHGPDGTDYPNKILYHEVVRPERLVYDHSDDVDAGGIHFQVTVSFTEHAGKTRLTMRMLFDSQAIRDQVVRDVGAIEGANQTLDRLAEHLARNMR